MKGRTFGTLAIAIILGAGVLGGAKRPASPVPPTAKQASHLIREGESHFAELHQLTFGGQNAEAYWSRDGRSLVFQARTGAQECDQQYVMDLHTGKVTLVSTGEGRTTCGYFIDGDRRVVFASTHEAGAACPPEPDRSQGYVWPVYPSYDIYTAKRDGRDLRKLVDHPGYDAEATVSRDGQWVLFTSARDGDIDLYRMRTDGSQLKRLTTGIGYDGGAFFSHDGAKIVWRTHRTDDSTANATFQRLLAQGLVRPSQMDIWVADADGGNARQITFKTGASFAPYFTPDDQSILYSSNWQNPRGRNFDLFLVPVAGGEPTRVTFDPDFDGFPMFSPDGRWLVFGSNRGGSVGGETNLFLARWKP